MRAVHGYGSFIMSGLAKSEYIRMNGRESPTGPQKRKNPDDRPPKDPMLLYSSNGPRSDSGLRPQLTASLCEGGPVAQLPEGHCGCIEDEGVQSHGMEH